MDTIPGGLCSASKPAGARIARRGSSGAKGAPARERLGLSSRSQGSRPVHHRTSSKYLRTFKPQAPRTYQRSSINRNNFHFLSCVCFRVNLCEYWITIYPWLKWNIEGEF